MRDTKYICNSQIFQGQTAHCAKNGTAQSIFVKKRPLLQTREERRLRAFVSRPIGDNRQQQRQGMKKRKQN